jgi:hypothetical protein
MYSGREIILEYSDYNSEKTNLISPLRAPAPSRAIPTQSPLCDPSQNGAFFVCLHWHSQASPVVSAVNFFGANAVPLCEPSQNGWFAESPQVQYQ